MKSSGLEEQEHWVTIDGRRGTGKSAAAAGVRSALHYGVLEVGCIFRLLAYLDVQKSGRGADAAFALIEAGRLVFDLMRGNALAATMVSLDGLSIMDDLWTAPVEARLPEVARNAVSDVGQLARRLITHLDVVIVGRHTGSELFSDAQTKIVLTADDAIRRTRKAKQIRAIVHRVELPREIDRVDPPGEIATADARTIDVTHLSHDDLMIKVLDIIRADRGALARCS